MTQTPYSVMSQFMQNDEQADLFLEKPVKLEILTALFKILNLMPHKENDDWDEFLLQKKKMINTE